MKSERIIPRKKYMNIYYKQYFNRNVEVTKQVQERGRNYLLSVRIIFNFEKFYKI